MLKNKFKIIALFICIILLISVPVSMAENVDTSEEIIINTNPEDFEFKEYENANTDDEHGIALINSGNDSVVINNDDTEGDVDDEEENKDIDIGSSSEDYKHEDVYLTGDDVTIDYTVDGNLFVIANKVTINSQIGGDAFIMANNITIGQDAYIFSNLFALTSNADIQGVVYDVYMVSQDVTISGYIYRDIKIATNTLNILGTIGRNAFVTAENISLKNASEQENATPIIYGDFNYSSNTELEIAEGMVEGTINYTQTSTNSGTSSIQDYLLGLGTFLVTVLIIWLLCLWIAPKFLDNTNKVLKNKFGPVVGLGILTPIILVISSIILILLGITSSIAILALGVFFLLIAISTSIFAITINNLICQKLKIDKKPIMFGTLIIVSTILWLIELVNYIGPVISIISTILGFGIITYYILFNKNIDKKKDKKD